MIFIPDKCSARKAFTRLKLRRCWRYAFLDKIRKKKEKTGKATRFNVSYGKTASKTESSVTNEQTNEADIEAPEGFLRRRLADLERFKSLDRLREKSRISKEFEERFGLSFRDFQLRGST